MAFCVSVSCRDDVFLCAWRTFRMKILICVVCFPDPVIFSSVFCIYRRMFRSVCDLIFAHFGRYGGSFCVCARVYGYDISYSFCFCAVVQALLRAFRGCFLTFGGIPACIFCRSASMRRLSRLARARISRVPDVGFGGGDGFACGLCRRSRIFSWFCRRRMRGFLGSCLRPESFCAA